MQDARAQDFRIDILMLIYAALMLWILFWAVTEFVLRRTAMLGWFVLLQVTHLAYSAAIMGYMAPLFPMAPIGVLDIATSLLACLVTLTSLIFYRILIAHFAPPVSTMRIFDILILASAATLVLLGSGFILKAMFLNVLVIFFVSPLMVLLVFMAKRDALPGLTVLRVIFTLQAGSILLSAMPFLGLMGALNSNLFAGVSHGLISAILIFIFLYLRARQIKEQGIQAEINLQLAEQQLAIEIEHRDLQNRFLAMLTHELKTPLSVARVSLDAMKVEGEFPKRITRALKSINDTVDRLMQADRIDQGTLPSTWGPCDVGAMIEEVVLTQREDRAVRIEMDQLPPLNCDGQLLAMAIGNLIDNALKYSPPDSVVDIRAVSESRAGRPGISIAVENVPSAAGLPDPDRIFSKFYRSSGAQSKSGSGLGLYVVRGIVKSMNGEVNYQPVSGKACFMMWLPC